MAYAEYRYSVLIREDHLDTFGHVNNAVYLKLFEEARWEAVTANNYGLKKVMESGQGPTILAINLIFKKELRLRKQVTIHTQIIDYVGKVGNMRQWMTNEAGEVCCEMEMKFGLFSLAERKLIPPTAEWLKAITE